MKLPLQVLYLEDVVRDAELFQDTLEANGIAARSSGLKARMISSPLWKKAVLK
jgi:hypothetical protein